MRSHDIVSALQYYQPLKTGSMPLIIQMLIEWRRMGLVENAEYGVPECGVPESWSAGVLECKIVGLQNISWNIIKTSKWIFMNRMSYKTFNNK